MCLLGGGGGCNMLDLSKHFTFGTKKKKQSLDHRLIEQPIYFEEKYWLEEQYCNKGGSGEEIGKAGMDMD